MFDVFAATPDNLKQQQLQAYTAYLRERDGELDLQQGTLTKREAGIARFETPPKQTRELDGATFRRHYGAFDRRQPPSTETLLLLALVKVNAAEAYGVTRAYQRTRDRALANDDEAELMILCEEGYHTRILLSAANLYGITVEQPYSPPSALRVLIGGIATLPMGMARPLTLAGEILATIMFMRLLDVTREVLAHAPEVRDSVEERLLEICTDERGHISYNQLQMGPAALAQTRLILPIVARTMATAFPELVALGAFPPDVLADLARVSDPKRMPEAVRRQAFIV